MPAQVLVLSRRGGVSVFSLRVTMLMQLRQIIRRSPFRQLRWLSDPAQIDPRDPAVVVFFGAQSGPRVSVADRHAEALLARRLFILPVVPVGADFSQVLPAALEGIVAYERVDGWESSAASRLLEELGWLGDRESSSATGTPMAAKSPTSWSAH